MDRIEVISAAVHTAWWAFSVLGLGESGVPWSEAPEWQKDSTRHTVRFYEEIDPSQMTIEYMSGLAHTVWMKQKIRDGWTFGSIKDPFAKTHPSLLDFNELSESERNKDRVVVEAYLAMRKALGDP